MWAVTLCVVGVGVERRRIEKRTSCSHLISIPWETTYQCLHSLSQCTSAPPLSYLCLNTGMHTGFALAFRFLISFCY